MFLIVPHGALKLSVNMCFVIVILGSIAEKIWFWLCLDSNHGPLANRVNALPLSYTESLSNCYAILYEWESHLEMYVLEWKRRNRKQMQPTLYTARFQQRDVC